MSDTPTLQNYQYSIHSASEFNLRKEYLKSVIHAFLNEDGVSFNIHMKKLESKIRASPSLRAVISPEDLKKIREFFHTENLDGFNLFIGDFTSSDKLTFIDNVQNRGNLPAHLFPNDEIVVILRNGKEITGAAKGFSWSNMLNSAYDIMKYAIIKKAEK